MQIKDPNQTKAHIYNTHHSDSQWICEHHKQNRWHLPETKLVLQPNFISYSHHVVLIATTELENEWNNIGRFLYTSFISALYKWFVNLTRK